MRIKLSLAERVTRSIAYHTDFPSKNYLVLYLPAIYSHSPLEAWTFALVCILVIAESENIS
jgi:hypothetical protein